MRIAFLGTGLMGEPMAQRLLTAGHNLFVFNRTTLKTEKLCANGAVLAFHPYDAIVQSEIIITMLADFSAVCDVLCSNKKNNFTGKLVVQMSTISPDESLLLKERIEMLGGEYIEAPVLGSIPQATDGSLQIMVGSSAQQFEKIKSVLESMGKQIILTGVVGTASAIKLALNQLIATTVASFSMSLGYLKEKEVDLEKFMEILRSSSLYSTNYDRKLPNLLNRDFDKTNFPVKHLLKDINLIINQFSQSGVDVSALNAVKNILTKSVQQKLSDKDYSAFYNVIHPQK